MKGILDFLDVPQRTQKPRKAGITLVRDQGYSPAQLEQLLLAGSQFIDYAKIKQFELFYMAPELTRAKIALYRKFAVSPFCGGTVVETAIIRGKVAETLSALREIGFQSIELSDNIVEMSLEKKIALTEQTAKLGFEIFFEYGKKYDNDPIDVAAASAEIKYLMEAGASRIILERSQLDATIGPDGKFASAGRLRELVDRIGLPHIIFEAETPAHVMWLLHEFGPDANLGPNIAVEYVISNLEPARYGLGRAEGYSFFERLNRK